MFCRSLFVLFLLAIVLSVLLRFTDFDYLFGIFWPLYCLSFDLLILITSLVSFGHCIVCPSSIYGFWLPLWYLLAIVLSVLLRFTDFDYLFGIFWPLYCLSFFDLRILILLAIVLSVLLRFIYSLVSFGHCIVCPSIYGFWLPLWYLLAIVLSVLSIYGFWLPLWYLLAIGFSSIYGFWLPLWYLLAIVLSVLLFTDFDYLFGMFWPLYCLSFYLRIWLPLWYLLAIVLSVLFTDFDYLFGIFWPLYCLSYLRILITSLVLTLTIWFSHFL